MSSLSEELVEISEQGMAAVLATVVEVEGSAKVEPGAKCLSATVRRVARPSVMPSVIEAIVRESDAHARLRSRSWFRSKFPDADANWKFFSK